MKYLTFDDVLIEPKFSMVKSRKDVDLSVKVSGIVPYQTLPIVSSPMDTVTGPEMCREMLHNGAQACLHRFWSIEENIKAFQEGSLYQTGLLQIPWVSVGLGQLELERAEALVNAGARTMVIDVAHGASQQVVDQFVQLKQLFKDNVGIIVGNFATARTMKDFIEHAQDVPDMFRVGIGGGSACTTRIKTGVGVPQLYSIMECSEVHDIIADGGVRNSGDVAKALAAGAKLVMLGGMLAGTDESPGEIITGRDFINTNPIPSDVNFKFKQYRGSASKESYQAQGKDESWRTAEGESLLVPYKGHVKDVLKDIEGGLRSSLSYVGAFNLAQFKGKAEFLQVSSNTIIESKAHGKSNQS